MAIRAERCVSLRHDDVSPAGTARSAPEAARSAADRDHRALRVANALSAVRRLAVRRLRSPPASARRPTIRRSTIPASSSWPASSAPIAKRGAWRGTSSPPARAPMARSCSTRARRRRSRRATSTARSTCRCPISPPSGSPKCSGRTGPAGLHLLQQQLRRRPRAGGDQEGRARAQHPDLHQPRRLRLRERVGAGRVIRTDGPGVLGIRRGSCEG